MSDYGNEYIIRGQYGGCTDTIIVSHDGDGISGITELPGGYFEISYQPYIDDTGVTFTITTISVCDCNPTTVNFFLQVNNPPEVIIVNVGTTITVTAPLGIDYEYQLMSGDTIIEPFKPGPNFNDVENGTYTVIAKIGDCSRESNELILNLHGFITIWYNSKVGVNITLPLNSSDGSTFDFVVDWGDGSTNHIVSAVDSNRIHTYANVGMYEVEIVGRCEGWSFNNSLGANKSAIRKIKYWGDVGKFDGFKYLRDGFYGCNNLTDIEHGSIIDAGITDLTQIFRNCSSLNNLPDEIFYNCVDVTTFNNAFTNCIALSSIPKPLFKYNTLVQYFSSTFTNCTSLIEIPEKLFDTNIVVTHFNATFYGCTSLTTIPSETFRFNVAAEYFYQLFTSCTSLTTIPSNLFRYNDHALSFNEIFSSCNALTTVPKNLFRYNTIATDFYGAFDGCNKLKLNAYIFYNDEPEKLTRFLNQSPDFTKCFNISVFTGVQGTAPELWDCTYGTGTPITTDCFDGHSIASVSNFASIPGAWL